MDFELTEEQMDIQKAAREFAETEFDKDYILDLELNHKYPWGLLQKVSELAFVTIDFREEYGEQGYGFLEKALALEVLCRIGAGVGSAVGASQFASKILLKSGSEEQKKKYLTLVCDGEGLPVAGAFTEADRGSDLITQPLSTTALKDGGDYILNGSKTFITHGPYARFAAEPYEKDPAVIPPCRGQSTIIIDKSAEQRGTSITEFMKMGHNSCSTVKNQLGVLRRRQSA